MSTDTVHLSNEALSVSVAALGAEMQTLRTASGADLLWHGDAAFWTGRAPVLFPIVGRAPGDRIAYGGLDVEMAQHGFARRNLFTLEAQDSTRCKHVLRASAQTKAVYPFDFELHISHTLNDATLTVSAQVVNAGDVPMPFGFGFHPAFVWPLPGADARPHQITLAQRGAPERRRLHDGLLEAQRVAGPFDNGVLDVTEAQFADGALVFPDGGDALRYGVDDGPGLLFETTGLPDLALWKPANAPFLCIEPWHGTAALIGAGPDIADRPNTYTLPPHASAEFAYRVTVQL